MALEKSNPLREYLRRHHINIADLARSADVPKTTIYSVTGGKGDVWNMGVRSFVRMAHALGLTGDQLVDALQEIEAEDA